LKCAKFIKAIIQVTIDLDQALRQRGLFRTFATASPTIYSQLDAQWSSKEQVA